jgi:hypothetical protein
MAITTQSTLTPETLGAAVGFHETSSGTDDYGSLSPSAFGQVEIIQIRTLAADVLRFTTRFNPANFAVLLSPVIKFSGGQTANLVHTYTGSDYIRYEVSVPGIFDAFTQAEADGATIDMDITATEVDASGETFLEGITTRTGSLTTETYFKAVQAATNADPIVSPDETLAEAFDENALDPYEYQNAKINLVP